MRFAERAVRFSVIRSLRNIYDPRNDEEHDVLLFQLDSEEGSVMWGDCGVANFFINADALKRMDFSDVLYNWDCC